MATKKKKKKVKSKKVEPAKIDYCQERVGCSCSRCSNPQAYLGGIRFPSDYHG